MNDLNRLSVNSHKRGAERFVSSDDLRKTAFENLNLELSPKPAVIRHIHRSVVETTRRLEFIKHPEHLLERRKRQFLVTGDRCQSERVQFRSKCFRIRILVAPQRGSQSGSLGWLCTPGFVTLFLFLP